MTEGFRSPETHDLPPARFLSSARIGQWLGVLARFPQLNGAMRMWMHDAKKQLRWREVNRPRVIETKIVKRDGTRAKITIDDSLSDVQGGESPAFKAWDAWLTSGALEEDGSDR